MTSPSPKLTIEGYAITSADGFIADRHGRQPDSLRHKEDLAYFRDALDQADIAVMGRRTHELTPAGRHRRRLVLSSRAGPLDAQSDAPALWLDPETNDVLAALEQLVPAGGRVVIAGGTSVYELFRQLLAYDAFHLSVANQTRLDQGVALFENMEGLADASRLLAEAGLFLAEERWLDCAAALSLLVFRRRLPSAQCGFSASAPT